MTDRATDSVHAAAEALAAREAALESGDPLALAQATIRLGQVYFTIGHLTEARRHLGEAARLAGADSRDGIQARTNIAASWRSEGRLDQAIELFDGLAADAAHLQDDLGATVLINAASAWHQVGRTDDAHEALDRAALMTERSDLLRWCNVIGAWVAAREGDVGLARRLASGWQADGLDLASSAVRAWADAAVRLDHQVDLGRARLACEEVLARAVTEKHRREERELHETLAQLAEVQGDLMAAVRHLRQATQIADEVQRGSARLSLEQEQLRLELVRMEAEADALRAHHAELAAARDRFQAAEATQRRLARSLSHDLRSPLMGFRAHLEILDPDDPDDVRKRVRALERTLDRIDAMLLGAERRDGDDPIVDAVAVVVESCDAFRALGGTKRQDIQLVAPAVLDVHGQKRDLGRVVDNLLSNALKYSPPGTVVDVTLQSRNDVAELVVRDRGPGFPGVRAADGLVYGSKLGSHVTGGESSTGLGLHAVYELVSKLGGAVHVGNHAQGGAVVRVSLRRAAD